MWCLPTWRWYCRQNEPSFNQDSSVGRACVCVFAAFWQRCSRGFGQHATRLRNGLRLHAQTRPARAKTTQANPARRKANHWCAGTRLTARASTDTVTNREKERLKFLYPARLELGVVTWPNGAGLDPGLMHEQVRLKKLWSVPF